MVATTNPVRLDSFTRETWRKFDEKDLRSAATWVGVGVVTGWFRQLAQPAAPTTSTIPAQISAVWGSPAAWCPALRLQHAIGSPAQRIGRGR